MLRPTHHRAFGFTLTELAIVLAIVGVLAAGLWNIMSGANTQVRDESAASQQSQLITAVKAFLVSGDGQSYMASNPACGGTCGIGVNFFLPLPSVPAANTNACINSLQPASMTLSQATTWCSDLPPGLAGPAAAQPTTNSYGQTYAIRILRDNTPVNQPPNTFSFMIMTSGGNTITDTSGARISSLIGGDGGFIYAVAVCGATPATVCGSYGGWSSPVATYGFGASAVGTVASRTYYSSEQNTFTSWLARVQLPGDPIFQYNTMTVPEYLGGTAPSYINQLNMGSYAAAMLPTGGGSINLQAGAINFNYDPPLTAAQVAAAGGFGTMNVQGGTINLNATGAAIGGGVINLQGGAIDGSGLSSINLTGDPTTVVSMLSVLNPSTCTMTSPNVPANCPYAVTATTVNVLNLLQASSLYAGTFIYNSSDIRLKKDIHSIHNTLDDVMQLNPVSFAFKSNDKKGLGFIAQDVEKIYPDLVVPGVDGMKAVNYEGFIAPLVASVQQLKKENDGLRQQIHDQEMREEKLEGELQKRYDK